MSEPESICFRSFYEQFYAGKSASLNTPQEARAILNAFVEYREFLSLPSRPEDARKGVTLIYKLLYHARKMEAAEAVPDEFCAEQHWKAVLEAWKLFLYAIYLDDACHPDQAPTIALRHRLRLWWQQTRAPLKEPAALPRRAWAMVWAVDSLREELVIEARPTGSLSHLSL